MCNVRSPKSGIRSQKIIGFPESDVWSPKSGVRKPSDFWSSMSGVRFPESENDRITGDRCPESEVRSPKSENHRISGIRCLESEVRSPKSGVRKTSDFRSPMSGVRCPDSKNHRTPIAGCERSRTIKWSFLSLLNQYGYRPYYQFSTTRMEFHCVGHWYTEGLQVFDCRNPLFKIPASLLSNRFPDPNLESGLKLELGTIIWTRGQYLGTVRQQYYGPGSQFGS